MGEILDLALATAPRDGGEEQFGVQSSARKVSGDHGSRSPGRGSGIKENDDRGTRSAERCAQDPRSPGQFLQARQQRA